MADRSNQYKCNECGKSFGSSGDLREHEKNCKGSSSRQRK